MRKSELEVRFGYKLKDWVHRDLLSEGKEKADGVIHPLLLNDCFYWTILKNSQEKYIDIKMEFIHNSNQEKRAFQVG